ncbi:MAG TPA: hypothetical protein VFH80_26060 [Solirubrobacteraceae bacterium]|nr:hypothetical protein [Solirubrobacteraceae bacterium]
MSSRPRRALVGLVVAAAALVALPASALAAGETLAVTPANTQAGGLTDVSTTLTFATGDTPKTVVTSLAPGLLGNLNANPACLLGTQQQLTPACQIGTASVSTTASPTAFTGKLYLVPAAAGSADASGVEFVPDSPPLTNQYIGVTLNPNAPGGLNLTTTFPNPTPAAIKSFTANFTTLNGQEFTRLPSSCSTATSTFNTTYYGATPASSASGSFTPTGCASLAYAPVLTAAIARDSNDSGGALTLGITQAANESASKSIVLQLPKGLTPNVGAVASCLNATGCKIGTATATSPIVPSVALANGTVTLTASGTVPSITISFPAPFAISLTGAVNLNNNTVTFANVPDVPLTALTLNVTGPSAGKAFTTDCAPANFGGTFTPQSGTAAKTVSAPIKFTGCALKPTVSGSTAGLASGHPKLKFKITHGKGAPNIAAVTLGLPGGLKFSKSAIVKHKTCTKASKGKKAKCSTKTLIKGLGIAGAKAKSVAIKGGKLVITLKKAAAKVTITASGPLVSESKSLQTKVKKHKTKTLKFTVKATDAKHTSTTVALKLKAH